MAYNPPSGDFVTTSLSGVLAAAATTATIGTGLTLPATNGVLTISYDSSEALGATDGPETIAYATYTTGTGALAGLTRGLAGTTDVQHSNGQSVCSPFSSLLFGTGQITGSMLSTTAVLLGKTEKTADFTTTTTGSVVDVTSLAVTVTVPAGGRSVEITAFTPNIASSAANGSNYMAIYEGATEITHGKFDNQAANDNTCMTISRIITPAAGAHTYKVGVYETSAGTLTFGGGATYPSYISVKLV